MFPTRCTWRTGGRARSPSLLRRPFTELERACGQSALLSGVEVGEGADCCSTVVGDGEDVGSVLGDDHGVLELGGGSVVVDVFGPAIGSRVELGTSGEEHR